MMMESTGDDYLADIPSELVVRAQQNMEFALKLLDRESRQGGDRRGRAFLDGRATRPSSMRHSITSPV